MTSILKFDLDRPIYQQIAEDIFKKIIVGNIESESKLPSVRELAVLYKVNPNTVQNVIKELQSMGIIEVKAGVGVFVLSNSIVENFRKIKVEDEIRKFLEVCRELKISKEDIEREILAYESK